MFNLRKSTLIRRILTLHALFLAPALIAAPSKEVTAQMTAELQDIRRNLAQEALEYFEGLNYSFSRQGDQLCRTIVTESIPMTQLDILAGNIRDIVDAIQISAPFSPFNTYSRKIERALRLQLYANRFAQRAMLYITSFNESEIPKLRRDDCMDKYSAIVSHNNAREELYPARGIREDFILDADWPTLDMHDIADSFSEFIEHCVLKNSVQSHQSNSDAVEIDEDNQNNVKRLCMTIDDEDGTPTPPSNTQIAPSPTINPTSLYRARSRKINYPNIGTQKIEEDIQTIEKDISANTQTPAASDFLQRLLSREQNAHDTSIAQNRTDMLSFPDVAKKAWLAIAQTMIDQIDRQNEACRGLIFHNNQFRTYSRPTTDIPRSIHAHLEEKQRLHPEVKTGMYQILVTTHAITQEINNREANHVKPYNKNIERIAEWQAHYQNILSVGIPYLQSLNLNISDYKRNRDQLIELLEKDRDLNVLPNLPPENPRSASIQKILDLQRVTLANKATRALLHFKEFAFTDSLLRIPS